MGKILTNPSTSSSVLVIGLSLQTNSLASFNGLEYNSQETDYSRYRDKCIWTYNMCHQPIKYLSTTRGTRVSLTLNHTIYVCIICINMHPYNNLAKKRSIHLHETWYVLSQVCMYNLGIFVTF